MKSWEEELMNILRIIGAVIGSVGKVLSIVFVWLFNALLGVLKLSIMLFLLVFQIVLGIIGSCSRI